MQQITQIYEKATAEEKVYLKSYIQSYSPYAGVKSLVDFSKSIDQTTKGIASPMADSSYNRSVAVSYAHQYAYSPNLNGYPSLSNLGGDCANFVSQCLRQAGKGMQDTWYIYQKNSTYMTPSSTSQLNYSWTLADPSPWISAKEFTNYWSNRASATYEYSVPDYVSNHNSIYGQSIYSGDPFQLLQPVYWWYEGYHTMIIVGYDVSNSDFLYAGHTNNIDNARILDRIGGASQYQSFHLKFYSMG